VKASAKGAGPFFVVSLDPISHDDPPVRDFRQDTPGLGITEQPGALCALAGFPPIFLRSCWRHDNFTSLLKLCERLVGSVNGISVRNISRINALELMDGCRGCRFPNFADGSKM
jgi:hypothetical protein